MKLLRVAPIALSIFVLGCESKSEIAATSADQTFDSARSQQEVADCIGRFRNRAAVNLTQEVQDDGSIVIFVVSTRGNNIGTTFTVRSVGSGSRTEVRRPDWAVLMEYRSCF